MTVTKYPKTPEELDNQGWVEIDEEKYDYCLECLPPRAYIRGGFVMGEPLCDSAEGTVYMCCVTLAGRFFYKDTTLKRIKEGNSAAEISQQFNMTPTLSE